MADELSERLNEMLSGSYDRVDWIVLNAYRSLAHDPGGFRVWWRRWHGGSDAELDNTHLMRLAGRFSQRVRTWAQANGVPVIDCKPGERKHRIATEYLAEHRGLGPGLISALHPVLPGPFVDYGPRTAATARSYRRGRGVRPC